MKVASFSFIFRLPQRTLALLGHIGDVAVNAGDEGTGAATQYGRNRGQQVQPGAYVLV